jgi:hypothetical protein
MLRLVFSFLSGSVGERSAILKFVPALLSLTNLALWSLWLLPFLSDRHRRVQQRQPPQVALAPGAP